MLSPPSFVETLEQLPRGRLAIGFSGGGDSTALVHLTHKLTPSPLILIVDHALRKESALEAEQAQKLAQSLGLEAKILTWDHAALSSGLQEKARKARYRLMGDACRKAGIKHLLTAHTADDQAETLLMRYDHNTGWRGAAGMAIKAYGPIWPELAGVNLIRPLLNVSRAKLRAYNKTHELNWIEDPSNTDRKYERIRARDYLSSRPATSTFLRGTASQLRKGLEAENKRLRETLSYSVDNFGLITTPRNIPVQFLKYCLLAASGTGQLVTREKLSSFAKKVRNDNFRSANIMGALCIRHNDQLMFGPDPVLFKGRNHQPPKGKILISPDHRAVWDGRFLISARHLVNVLPAKNSKGSYWPDGPDWNGSNEIAFHLSRIPSEFRGAMPIFWRDNREFLGTGTIEMDDFSSICLVSKRIEQLLGK